jgi:hypothetical protein
MRVEAGRETGARIGCNQSRPGDRRRHAQIETEASVVLRKCPEDIGHHHYQGGALRRLLIHAIEEPKQRYHKEATADSEQPAKKTGHPTEARCGGDVNCCCEHRGLMSRVSGDATVPSRDHRGHEGNRTRQQGQVRCRVRSGKSTLTKTKVNRFHNPVRNRTGDRVTINLIRHKGEADILG